MTGSYLLARPTLILPMNKSMTAEMDGPLLTLSSRCRMRIHMFKNSRNSSLLVILQNVNTGKRYELSEIGAYGYRWSYYSFSLGYYPTGVYKVIFTATLRMTLDSFSIPYIALDDISFSSQCTLYKGPIMLPTLPNHSPITTPLPDNCTTISCTNSNGTKICLMANQFCDFFPDCKDETDEINCGNCKFDDEKMCGWKTVNSVQNWIVLKPASSSPNNMPRFDGDGNASGGYLTIRSFINFNNLFMGKH